MPPQPDGHEHLRLSDIPTNWSDVDAAHSEGPGAREAQDRLLRRYGPAILRYLIAVTHNTETASELFQVFAHRFVEGKLKNATPERGKFRSYLKTTLIRLATAYRERASNQVYTGLEKLPDLVTCDTTWIPDADRQFVDIWRAELLRTAFDELQELERTKGLRYFTALEIKLRDPDARSRKLADSFNQATGEQLSSEDFRRLMHLARQEFEDRLLRIIQDTLPHPSLEELEEEMIELGLHSYCRPALERRRALQSM